MAAKSRGLGKGLSALMSEEYSQHMDGESHADDATGDRITTLPVTQVHSGQFQPRHHFDEVYLKELSDSIRSNGVMQPIIVRPSPQGADSYEIIAGERRWRASQLAGLNTIPAIIRDIEDKQALELALVENVQRQDLNAIEEAAGYQQLINEFGYTQQTLAGIVGKSRSHVANLLRLLSLPDTITPFIESGQITMGHARALLNAEDPEALAAQVIEEELNVRQTELLAKGDIHHASNGKPQTKKGKSGRAGVSSADKDGDIIALESALSDNLGLKVAINDQGNSGEIVLHYSSLAQLDDILQRLGGAAI